MEQARSRAPRQGSNFEEIYQTNFESLQVVQSKTVQIFQSLQQRGTTAQFKAMSTTNVRADGRSVRVPIGRARLEGQAGHRGGPRAVAQRRADAGDAQRERPAAPARATWRSTRPARSSA